MKKVIIKRVIKWTLLSILLFFAIMILLSFFINVSHEQIEADNLFPENYTLLEQEKNGNYQQYTISDIYDGLTLTDELVQDETYQKKALKWLVDDEISFKINIAKSGHYQIAFDYASLQKDVQDISISLYIDGEASENIVLPTYWTSMNKPEEHIYDIYQNEVNPTQVALSIWRHYYLYDQRFYQATPISYELTEGEHQVIVHRNDGQFLLGDIYVVEEEQLSSYTNPSNAQANDEMIVLEGEHPYLKSASDIGGSIGQLAHLTPYSTNKNMINALSGDSFNTSGKSVTYCFNVEQAGFYQIALKYYISQTNTSVYSKILIDNQVLYDEMNRYCFKNLLNNTKAQYRYEILNSNGNNMLIYLEPGVHSLTLQLDASKQAPIYYELLALIDEMNELYLEVIKLTGGLSDKNKTWNLDKYIPTAATRLNDWKDRLANLLVLIE